ncbi:PIR protein [Plasmodium ovale]|uniref:PIR Superfamily Protein n=2 Tax=Plasmodium ovale TaxID=36330 RepID=A0A1A8WC52_PLAOA|nr:PIR Superfamily Protein [Plasmodium ovale curtisi]SBT82923.1 PIR protein [Plasmodium ovale]
MSSKNPEIYSFFKDFTEYKKYEQGIKVILEGGHNVPQCDYFSSDSRNIGTESVKNICIKFMILYNIIDKQRGVQKKTVDNKDFAYLNYWLNNLSKNTTSTNKITIEEFQRKVGGVEGVFATVLLDDKLYDMNDEEFNNTNLLNKLLTIYSDIFQYSHTIVKGNISCIKYFQECINAYKKCIIKCPVDDTSFCKALKNFKEAYNYNFLGEIGVSKDCHDVELLKLPTYEDVSGNKQITIVGTILGPSFATLFSSIFLYKFTPLGQWIRAKMGTRNGTHSNLYKDSDQLLLNILDKEHIKSEYNEFSISYDSIVNS